MDHFALLPLGLVEFLGQRLEAQDLAIVGLLIVLEGVLSIDNALVLGLLAKRLPKHQQAKALTYGLIGAFVFRFLAIGTATFLLQWTFVKFLGGAYLVYIAVRHLFFESQEEEKDKIVLDEHGHPILVEEETGEPLPESEEETEIRERVPVYMKPETRTRVGMAGFWPTVLVIELTDIAFAVDSILAAIALVGSKPPGTAADAVHPKLWVVITGGLIGVVLMRFAAAIFIKMLDRFPRFEVSAYLLVIVIGLKLLADWGANSDWSFDQPQWAARGLGSAKQSFEEFEETRRGWVQDYETWLAEHWIFGLSKHSDQPQAEPPGTVERPHDAVDSPAPQEADDGLPHTPHLLDFHSPSRPEFILFWTLMVVCFGLGFIPKQSSSQAAPLPDAAGG